MEVTRNFTEPTKSRSCLLVTLFENDVRLGPVPLREARQCSDEAHQAMICSENHIRMNIRL